MAEDAAGSPAVPMPVPEPLAPEAAPIAGDVLPLTRGVYVLAGVQCADPPNAALLVFDGRGISGSATRDCRTSPIKPQGQNLQINQSCVDTQDGKRRSVRQMIQLQGFEAFAFVTRWDTTAYRLCRELDPAAFGFRG